MIIELLVNVFVGPIFLLLDLLTDVVQIPANSISVLGTFMGHGIWILGLDILLMIFSSVSFWMVTFFTVKPLEWLWSKIPFI